MGSSNTSIARDRHLNARDFAGDASKRLEHAVMCVRLRAPVAGAIVIRVRDVHSLLRTAQDSGRRPGLTHDENARLTAVVRRLVSLSK